MPSPDATNAARGALGACPRSGSGREAVRGGGAAGELARDGLCDPADLLWADGWLGHALILCGTNQSGFRRNQQEGGKAGRSER
jgi:hypothetical protein